MSLIYFHPYHMVDQSPWPLVSGFSAFLMTSGLVIYFFNHNLEITILGMILTIFSSIQWWRDTWREATYQGHHTKVVEKGMRYGMILFIISEILFFFSFFWAFFHSSLTPSIDIGMQWPPKNIMSFNAFQVPLLNTIILISSGVSITWSHHSIIVKNYTQAIQGLILTVILGIYFTFVQAYEYMEASFSMADSVYGSVFFIATGFHGFHVIVGTLFLSVCLYRMMKGHFMSKHHTGFETAAWYWHFVDVVWLFLFVTIYWWGGN